MAIPPVILSRRILLVAGLSLLWLGVVPAQEANPSEIAAEERGEDLRDKLQAIRENAASAEELIVRQEALLAPALAAEQKALADAPKTTIDPDNRDAGRQASLQRRTELATLRAESDSAEELISRIEIWESIYAMKAPPLEAPVPERENPDELQTILHEIRTETKSPEALVAAMEAFFQLNPFLLDPNPPQDTP